MAEKTEEKSWGTTQVCGTKKKASKKIHLFRVLATRRSKSYRTRTILYASSFLFDRILSLEFANCINFHEVKHAIWALRILQFLNKTIHVIYRTKKKKKKKKKKRSTAHTDKFNITEAFILFACSLADGASQTIRVYINYSYSNFWSPTTCIQKSNFKSFRVLGNFYFQTNIIAYFEAARKTNPI